MATEARVISDAQMHASGSTTIMAVSRGAQRIMAKGYWVVLGGPRMVCVGNRPPGVVDQRCVQYVTYGPVPMPVSEGPWSVELVERDRS